MMGAQVRALRIIREQLAEAVDAAKCHRCGCMHQTVEALSETEFGLAQFSSTLSEARATFVAKEYDCLGCAVCFPAVAANALAEAFPEEGEELDLCPTEEPELRAGWPPLAGDYHLLRYRAPVAVCTLNSEALAAELAASPTEALAIAGTMHTENLGIERLIQNILPNPHIRFLILCGEDTKQAIGHLPGQSLERLFANGTNERGRIQGAKGKRPLLKNVSPDEIAAFRAQVELVSLIGEQRQEQVRAAMSKCALRDPGPFEGAALEVNLPTLWAEEPKKLVLDPAGFLVVYPEARRGVLVVEHYTKQGVLTCVLEGKKPAAISAELIERSLITRLDHAAYLGRELARAERSMQTGETYVQDRAPGDAEGEENPASCGCSGSCS